MRGYRRVQENKAYRLYVVGTISAKKRKVTIRPALLGDYNMNVETYYFTDKEDPSDGVKGDCIYVEFRSVRKRKKTFRSTMLVHNTAWNSTAVAFTWSRWH
jgi:hypothetical protein